MLRFARAIQDSREAYNWDVRSLHPKQPGDFARWLARNRDRAAEVWLVFYKKTSGRQTVAYKHALQEAMRYGWIDSRVKSMDAERFTVRFTPRMPGSPWSKRNLKLAEALLESGKMTKAGLAALPPRLRRKASSVSR
jgi:uncharacterized protein YdeI (YjbR/CyaY-like superfamily)